MGNPALCLGFTVLCLGMAALVCFAFGTRTSALFTVGWLFMTGLAASSGWLANFSTMPPHFSLLLGPALLLAVWLGVSTAGRSLVLLPVSVLIGFQAFRILVELLIHQAVAQGIAPVQMTWTGMNWDILSGVTALIVAPLAGRLPKKVLLGWNIMGLGLLLWIIGVALLSMPTIFQRLHPSNTWVAALPFVWLPTVLVPCALLGHVVLFRRLAMEQPEPHRHSWRG
ncbi:MAG: hypothetical protein JWO94_3447 [Verrucomicrobiaceae bacterium]|nr:hypothetical protein [Verrucomicrobiaceae bacterium]